MSSKSGKNQHYVPQRHQRQFSAKKETDPNNKEVQVFNHVKPGEDYKGVQKGLAKTRALFVAKFAYDDKYSPYFQADHSIVTEEENTILRPVFDLLGSPSIFEVPPRTLAEVVAHYIRRGLAVRKGTSRELLDVFEEVLTTLNNNKEGLFSILQKNRHQWLNTILTVLNSKESPEAIDFSCFLVRICSQLDFLFKKEGTDFLKELVNSFSLNSSAGLNLIDSFKKVQEEFIKLGHIKGLLESNSFSSEYADALENNFDISVLDIDLKEHPEGLILADNPVCFVRHTGNIVDTFRFCSIEDLPTVQHIFLPLSPDKLILCFNKQLKNPDSNFEVPTLNRLLASVASNNYISKSQANDKYTRHIDTGKNAPSSFIPESELVALKKPETYLSLNFFDELKENLIAPDISDEDKEKLCSKLLMPLKSLPQTSPLHPLFPQVNAGLNTDSYQLSLDINRKKRNRRRIIKNPTLVTVKKGSTLDFKLTGPFIKNFFRVVVSVFNTNAESLEDTIYDVNSIKPLGAKPYFVWKTEGVYLGSHLAIFAVKDAYGSTLFTKKVLVRVVSSF